MSDRTIFLAYGFLTALNVWIGLILVFLGFRFDLPELLLWVSTFHVEVFTFLNLSLVIFLAVSTIMKGITWIMSLKQ